jgi:hypothetical protein
MVKVIPKYVLAALHTTCGRKAVSLIPVRINFLFECLSMSQKIRM